MSNAKTAIRCPRGTYTVYRDLNIVCITVLDVMCRDTALGLINSVNRILETDRTAEWMYCLHIGHKTISTLDAERKLKEFVRFRIWLASVTEKACRVAVILEYSTQTIENQIKRVLLDPGLSFRTFTDPEKAYNWLNRRQGIYYEN